MAHGYALGSGSLGVALIGEGPELTDALPTMLAAQRAAVPLLVLVTTRLARLRDPCADRGRDVLGLTYPVSKHSEFVEAADCLAPTLEHGCEVALRDRRGVVVFGLHEAQLLALVEFVQGHVGTSELTVPARDVLHRAQRPALYVGARRALDDWQPVVERLARGLGAPILTSELREATRRALAEADVCVALGREPDDWSVQGSDALVDLALDDALAEEVDRILAPLPREHNRAWAERWESWPAPHSNGIDESWLRALRTLQGAAERGAVFLASLGRHQAAAATWLRAHRWLDCDGPEQRGDAVSIAVGLQACYPERDFYVLLDVRELDRAISVLASARPQRLYLIALTLDEQSDELDSIDFRKLARAHGLSAAVLRRAADIEHYLAGDRGDAQPSVLVYDSRKRPHAIVGEPPRTTLAHRDS